MFVIMSRVFNRKSTLVFESDCRFGEVDTVSLEIARRFDRILLEVHDSNVCTNVHHVKGLPDDFELSGPNPVGFGSA